MSLSPSISRLRLPATGDARRWWPRAAQWTLVTLLGIQALRLAWLAALPPAPIGALPDAGTRPPASSVATGVDPFFPATDPGTRDAGVQGLVLHGIRDDASGGGAILADADGVQRAWRVGDTVRPGLTLAVVADDHVLFDSGGRRQRLAFTPAPAAAGATTVPGTLPRGLAASATDAADAGIDPAQLLAQAGLQPLLEGDRVAGYTLVPRGDGALLRQAGLAAGDVLLAVNGEPLTPERYSTLAADLASASELTISYRRGTETLTTTVQAPSR